MRCLTCRRYSRGGAARPSCSVIITRPFIAAGVINAASPIITLDECNVWHLSTGYHHDLYAVFFPHAVIEKLLQEKAVEATKQKEERRKKPKPEEHEGMPQR
jgi:hypothetical protein